MRSLTFNDPADVRALERLATQGGPIERKHESPALIRLGPGGVNVVKQKPGVYLASANNLEHMVLACRHVRGILTEPSAAVRAFFELEGGRLSALVYDGISTVDEPCLVFWRNASAFGRTTHRPPMTHGGDRNSWTRFQVEYWRGTPVAQATEEAPLLILAESVA